MSSNRPDKVASLIGQVISKTLLCEMHDESYSQVVVTDTRMTKNLEVAHLYFTLLGEQKPHLVEAAGKALADARPFLRRQIGRSVRLKYTPELQFHYDETLQRARRVEDLLSSIQPIRSEDELEDSKPSEDEQ